MAVLRIGPTTLDTSDGTLRTESGDVTRLEPKVLMVLLLLIAKRGGVVPSEFLLREGWPDTHVAPGALARTISQLRRALGDDAADPRYIETVPKRGYRFIAAVDEPTLEQAPACPRPALIGIRRWRYATAALVALALAIIEPCLRPGCVGRHADATVWSFRHDTRAGNEEAVTHYTKAIRLNPGSADAYAGLATAYAFRANYLPDRTHWASAALDAARKATVIEPANVFGVRAVAIAHAQAGRLKQAASSFEHALQLYPDDAATRTNLGRMRMLTGEVAEALAFFEQHAAREPTNPTGYAHLAAGLAIAGYPTESAGAARAALQRDANAAAPHLLLARIDLLNRNYEGAKAELTQALEIESECAQCIVQLGLVEQLAGNSPGAVARYREAGAIAPQFAAARLRLAQVLTMAGQRTEAERLLAEVETAARAAIGRGDETWVQRWHLAGVAAIRGNRTGALDWYRAAVEAGRRDWTWDLGDPLFHSLHSEPAFAAAHQPGVDQHHAASGVAARVRSMLALAGRH